MKGSHKFWSIIAIVIIFFANYLTFFTDFIPEPGHRRFHHVLILMLVCLSHIACAFGILSLFFVGILPKINKYLDEKF